MGLVLGRGRERIGARAHGLQIEELMCILIQRLCPGASGEANLIQLRVV